MKIGIIAHLKHPIRKPFMGGLEAFTYDICKRLEKRGHQVILYASSGSDAASVVKPILEDHAYNHLTGTRFTSHELCQDFITTHHAYVELMQDIDFDELDIIFNNSLNYVPIMMASVVRTPMLTVLHTPPIFEMKKAVSREQTQGKIRYVSVSEKNARSWSPYVSSCQVINNGIDLSTWQYYPENQKEYILWFGRIHPDKGLHLAILAAKAAGKRLKIAGTISDPVYYEEWVKPLLDDTTELIGHCTPEELNVLIGNAEVCVITPCWEEPFGLVVAESLACGTPVAGISRGALPTLLSPQTGCLSFSTNPESLAACIHEAARMDRQACRQRAETFFDVERMVDAYEETFLEMIAQHQSIPYAV